MIIESYFLTDQQVEDLQMIAEIINEIAISDGFPNLDACLEKYPKRRNIYNPGYIPGGGSGGPYSHTSNASGAGANGECLVITQ